MLKKLNEVTIIALFLLCLMMRWCKFELIGEIIFKVSILIFLDISYL
jgi:hypothetical protein